MEEEPGGPAELAPRLADLVPRLRVEREVIWADGRGLDSRRLGARLVDRLAELGVRARAGVSAVPVTAELAARWGASPGSSHGATPFLVKERTGWGWRRTLRPASTGSPAVSGQGRRAGGRQGTAGGRQGTAGGRQGTADGGQEVRPVASADSEGATPSSDEAPERGATGAVVVVPAGRERAWLAALPVTALEPADRLRTLLEGVGVATVGALASLEREAVEVRLGGPAVDLWRRARADDRRVLFDRIPPERPHGSLEFVDYVLTDPSRLLFTANSLLGPLCDGMTGRGEHARTLRLVLPLANGEQWERTLRPARPTASRETWLRLIRELLDRLTVPDAVAGMRIEVGATEEAAVRQGDLFDRGFATAAAVEAAVSRLAERQVRPLRPASTAHPLLERRGQWVPVSSGGENEVGGPVAAGSALPAATTAPSEGAGQGLGLQLLPTPRRVAVETVPRRDHEVPIRLRDRGDWRELVLAAGPDRISGGQWEPSSYAREYYRCVTEAGVPLWIYRDALEGSWYLHGWWD